MKQLSKIQKDTLMTMLENKCSLEEVDYYLKTICINSQTSDSPVKIIKCTKTGINTLIITYRKITNLYNI